MYLRRHRRSVDGATYEYWTLVESRRTVSGPRQHTVATPGQASGARGSSPRRLSPATYHRWQAQYGGANLNTAKELKALKEESAKLKKLMADLSLDKVALKVGPPRKREAVGHLQFKEAGHGGIQEVKDFLGGKLPIGATGRKVDGLGA